MFFNKFLLATLSSKVAASNLFNLKSTNSDGIKNGDGEVVLTVDADQNVTVANGNVTAQEFFASNGNYKVGAGQGMGLYSMGNVTVYLDNDQGSSPGSNSFKIKNGSDAEVLNVRKNVE